MPSHSHLQRPPSLSLMDSEPRKADQRSDLSFSSDPVSKPSHISSDSSFSGWSSDDDDAGDDDVPPPLDNTPVVAVASSISHEIKTLSDHEEEEEDVGCLLDSLPRERLISLLLSSATRNAEVRREIRRSAEHDPAICKITVRNLPWRTTSQDLYTLFSQYGAIRDCHVATDCSSGRSKGFGFVHFFNPNSATQALQCPQKRIGDRVATCLLVAPHQHHTDNDRRCKHVKNVPRKIYVARVEPEVDKGKLYEFFSKYGEIEEGPIGFDKYTGKSRGYAMFVYKTKEGIRRALEEPMKNFEGYLLHCQPAVVGKVNSSGFKRTNRWLNSGPDSGNYGSDFEVPPGYEDPWFCS